MARVLIHSLTFPPDGVSTAYIYGDICKQLKLNGHKVLVLTTTPHFNILESVLNKQHLQKKALGFYYKSVYNESIEVYHVPIKKSKRTIFRIFSFIKFHVYSIILGFFLGKIDVIISPSPPYTLGLVSWVLAKIKKAKTIYNVQEIYPDFAIKIGIIKNKYIISILKYIEKLIYNLSDIIVTIDIEFTEIIRDRVKDQRKLIQISNFVDTEIYIPMSRSNEFSRKHNLEDKFVVAYAGNIGFAQNWEPIIYASKKLIEKPIVFLIIGDGVKKEWLQNKINQNGLDNILLLPYQNREKIPLINATGDIHTIIMSKNISNAGFPSKIYTIMSCSRSSIVVADLNSPLARFMKQANYGKVLEDDDNETYVKAIISAFENREWLKYDGERGRNFVLKNFSKEHIGTLYSNLVNQLNEK